MLSSLSNPGNHNGRVALHHTASNPYLPKCPTRLGLALIENPSPMQFYIQYQLVMPLAVHCILLVCFQTPYGPPFPLIFSFVLPIQKKEINIVAIFIPIPTPYNSNCCGISSLQNILILWLHSFQMHQNKHKEPCTNPSFVFSSSPLSSTLQEGFSCKRSSLT